MRLLVLLGWVWVLFGVVKSENLLTGMLGDNVLLKPSVTSEITSITWKQGPNLAVQWDGSNINYYREFKERGSLDVKSGILTIKNLILSDSNDYTPEINSVLQSKIVLKVYRSVPKPTIQFEKIEGESCSLTCAGDTKDAEPVTYSWAKDNETLVKTEREITQPWKECSSSYTCTMANPVNSMKSDPVTPNTDNQREIGIGVGAGLGGLVFILAIIHRFLTGEWFYQKGLKCWKADFWKKSTDQPGNANNKEETTRMAKDS